MEVISDSVTGGETSSTCVEPLHTSDSLQQLGTDNLPVTSARIQNKDKVRCGLSSVATLKSKVLFKSQNTHFPFCFGGEGIWGFDFWDPNFESSCKSVTKWCWPDGSGILNSLFCFQNVIAHWQAGAGEDERQSRIWSQSQFPQ